MFKSLEPALARAVADHYGRKLVALALFGSVARATARPDSDIDLFIVADDLPDGRVARAADFSAVERAMAPWTEAARRSGLSPVFSPVFKTRPELAEGTPLLLDMVDDANMLLDESGCLRRAIETTRQRLAALGARRIWLGDAWVWDLKPDYRPGDLFEL